MTTVPNDNPKAWAAHTRFHWAKEPSGSLVIFVHGFGGQSTTTWQQFVELWPESFAGCDLVFYGYESLCTQVGTNSALLASFLETLMQESAHLINGTIKHLLTSEPNLRRPDNFTFTKIVIVAHSLGAIIARQALILEENQPWISRTRLALFAPAHKGAFPLGLALEALTSVQFGTALGAAVRYYIAALDGLDRNGTIVTELESNTKNRINGGRGEPFIAALVVFAEKERVVVNDPLFASDPTPKVFTKKNHTQVCKPTEGWKEPIDVIMGIL